MAGSSKKLKYSLIFLSILILVSGIWLYSTVYRDSMSALQRAESFLFNRMTISQLGEQGVMRYFFVSNRKKQEAEDPLDQFGRDRESELKFGLFDTKVEPTVGLGMFINPSEWFQNEEITIKNLETLNRDKFLDKLKQVVAKSPQRSLLVVVHGFREAYPSALRKTAFLGHILDINSPVLLFDWPGNQGSSLSGYRQAREIAIQSGHELASTLELLVNEVQPEKLWVVANSMGGQVVVEAMSHLYNNPDFSDNQVEFEDIILTAPDVGQDEFDNKFKEEIKAMTRDLTVYVSSNDRALIMSRIINREARLGESHLNPDMLDEAIRVSDLMDADQQRMTLVDVTPVNRTRNFHNFSLETPEFFDDLYLRLINEKTPETRKLYNFSTESGKRYWVLTPGR